MATTTRLLPGDVAEIDRELELCRQTLHVLQVRSSEKLVWEKIDELLDHRVRVKRRLRRAARIR